MPTFNNRDEVKQAAKKMLTDKGVSDDSADYLADLYADSDRGKANVAGGGPAPAATCSGSGIIPIG